MKAKWHDIILALNAGTLRQVWACWECDGNNGKSGRCEIMLPLGIEPEHCLQEKLNEKVGDE